MHQDFAGIPPGSRGREPTPASRPSEAVDGGPERPGPGRGPVPAELGTPDPRT
ncbi:hypothetical protein [Streptomyces sp. NPDC002580]|uniref:hypothetical protein n=1 Tax=Streptomyces sp. NPDC002580 TaxID=3364653 RepID=UPI00368C188A